MRQQINLHQPIFRRERKTLSAITVATTLGVVAVALTAFSLYTARGVGRLQSRSRTADRAAGRSSRRSWRKSARRFRARRVARMSKRA